MTKADSRCLAEAEGQPGWLLLPSHPLQWQDRMKGCMSPLPALLPLPSPAQPPVVQPHPSFIFVVRIIFKPLILFVHRVFKKKQHSVMSKSFQGMWEAREGGEKSFKQIAKYWTCVKSCIIYEICIKIMYLLEQ